MAANDIDFEVLRSSDGDLSSRIAVLFFVWPGARILMRGLAKDPAEESSAAGTECAPRLYVEEGMARFVATARACLVWRLGGRLRWFVGRRVWAVEVTRRFPGFFDCVWRDARAKRSSE